MTNDKKSSERSKDVGFKFKHKISLVSVSLVLLVFVDILLRLAYPLDRPIALYKLANSAKIYLEDFSLGWKLIPNLCYRAPYNFSPPPRFPCEKGYYNIETNSMGLRNKKIQEKGNRKRVICIGDSITFGWGVKQIYTYPSHLEWLLNAKYPGEFEVINAGIPGYTSRQGLVFYVEKLKGLKPDYIIISFGANDSTFAPIPDKNSVRYKTLTAGLHKILCLSRIYTLMRGSMLPLKKTLIRYDEPYTSGKLVRRVSPDDYYENLKDIVKTAEKEGTKPILLITTKEDEYSRKMSLLAREMKIPLVKGFTAIHARKKEIMTDRRFVNLRRYYISLLGEANLMANPSYFLFVDPVHPSGIGHKIIAEELFKEIDLLESENQER